MVAPGRFILFRIMLSIILFCSGTLIGSVAGALSITFNILSTSSQLAVTTPESIKLVIKSVPAR